MSKYEKLKGYYESGLWDKTRLRNAVVKGWLSEEEYARIVGGEETEGKG